MNIENQSWLVAPEQKTGVLVIDDDCGLRQTLRAVLEAEGYQVMEAASGAEAIALCRSNHPALVLLDAKLPEMDGLSCYQALLKLDPTYTPDVLMLTAGEDEVFGHRALAEGAIDYVTKPINLPILKQRIRRLIQQSQLIQQLQRSNARLSQYAEMCNIRLREQTDQIAKGLTFESTLKRITDKVRDSLNQNQILQTAVQELAWTLELACCNASLYDEERKIAHVLYEYSFSIPGYLNRVLNMEDFPEIYCPLLNETPVQFCSLLNHPFRDRVALFAFPISDGHSIGDLWLICHAERVLENLEIRLVQQVANQCAIALRQARLYQESQAQVQVLEKLNHLKDDFLSTVSHELRTPMTNMRLSIQLLEQLMQECNQFEDVHPALSRRLVKCTAYLKILHIECEREISLINDLLDLQRLENQSEVPTFEMIDLHEWLPQEVEGLGIRVHTRQQTLRLSLAEHLPPFQSDPLCLRRVLFELINNAYKHSPDGALIVVAAMADASQMRLSITNTGVEIPLYEQTRIFDKFYRVTGGDRWKQSGTGLGLSLVKRLVDHLGGSIEVVSQAGETCFTVLLPL